MESIVREKQVRMIPATLICPERDIRKRQLRVAAYCRVSTNNEEQLSSYKSQIEYYTNKINENPNWTMAGIFADEGLSGTSTKKRKEFNRMIQKCKKGRIDLILTKSISRFSRNTLDCLTNIRMLKSLGIGVVLEKEGVNTMEEDDETILTILGSFAQAESESLSKNVKLGFRQSFKAGKVPFHYKGFLGYRRGADGQPEIVPEEAEIVKRIFHRYLAGQSVPAIKKELESDGIPSPKGKEKWSVGVIQYMLRNERYIGDALLQKTYISDMLTKRIKKNNGEQPQYYVENNHVSIVDRDTFQRVQEEISRRNSKHRVSSNAKTELSKYSSQYALTELLVCGCCGTPYRRVTWTRPEGKKIVWRCINRLEHGKQYCKDSVTLEESKLHEAIMSAISEVITRGILLTDLKAIATYGISVDQTSAEVYKAQRRIKELDESMRHWIELSAKAGGDEDFYDAKFKMIHDEKISLEAFLRKQESNQLADRGFVQEVNKTYELLEHDPLALTKYDDQKVRELIDTIRVMDKNMLLITFKENFEMEQIIPA